MMSREQLMKEASTLMERLEAVLLLLEDSKEDTGPYICPDCGVIYSTGEPTACMCTTQNSTN